MAKKKKAVREISIEQEKEEMGDIVKYIGPRNRLLFTCSMMVDILTNSVENSLVFKKRSFTQERKRAFKDYVNSIESCKDKYDKCADSILWEEGNDSCNQFRQDANEMLRVLMYYVNAVKTEKDYMEIMNLLKERSDSVNDKVFTDEEISRFNYKKLSNVTTGEVSRQGESN